MDRARHGLERDQVLQGLGVLALAVIGVVHLYLYLNGQGGAGYRVIPTIGPLFLMTVIVAWAFGSAVAVLSWMPPLFRLLVPLAAALFAASVLGGYILTLLLPKGLFLFTEPYVSYSGGIAIAAEVLAFVSLGLLALRDVRRSGLPLAGAT